MEEENAKVSVRRKTVIVCAYSGQDFFHYQNLHWGFYRNSTQYKKGFYTTSIKTGLSYKNQM